MHAALTVVQTIGVGILILVVLAIPILGLMLLAGAMLRQHDHDR
jgi:UPF0716 family protein affecting phage T7 exclusion